MTITSPCTGVCKYDAETGWCLGCGRSEAEIAGWGVQPDGWRQVVWDEIPGRMAEMGVACRRLAWATEGIRDFVQSTLEAGRGTWVMGVVGAVAEFTAATDAKVHVRRDGDLITATTRNGALRMIIDDDVRALTFDTPSQSAPQRVVLAVKRERGRLPMAETVADLGADETALIRGEETRLFDLGLGRKEARFCVRVGTGASRDALEQAAGVPFAQALAQIAKPLVEDSPPRVIETALGRIEVEGQIPPPNATSPDGPHTHLLPDHLETGRALPVGMEMPRAYLPGAMFFPPK